jgi:hypothetical protein
LAPSSSSPIGLALTLTLTLWAIVLKAEQLRDER